MTLAKSLYLPGPPFSHLRNGDDVPTLYTGWGAVTPPPICPCSEEGELCSTHPQTIRMQPRPSPLGGAEASPPGPLPLPSRGSSPSSVRSFIQHVFIKSLLCARHCSRPRATPGSPAGLCPLGTYTGGRDGLIHSRLTPRTASPACYGSCPLPTAPPGQATVTPDPRQAHSQQGPLPQGTGLPRALWEPRAGAWPVGRKWAGLSSQGQGPEPGVHLDQKVGQLLSGPGSRPGCQRQILQFRIKKKKK